MPGTVGQGEIGHMKRRKVVRGQVVVVVLIVLRVEVVFVTWN